MDVNKGKMIKCVERLKKMVRLTSKKEKKKKKNRGEDEGASDSPPRPVHCEELFLQSEKPGLATSHILRSHIIAHNYFSQKPNIYL